MANVPLTKPFTLKAATLKIDVDNFEAAVTGVTFTPSVQAQTVQMINGDRVAEQSPAEWSVDVSWLQDLAAGGLSRYLLTNDGKSKTIVFVPQTGAPAPLTLTATVILSPGPLGGEAGPQPAAASASWVLIGPPVAT